MRMCVCVYVCVVHMCVYMHMCMCVQACVCVFVRERERWKLGVSWAVGVRLHDLFILGNICSCAVRRHVV